ncbi:MAG: TIGR03009 domain-containing protein [Thermogutta sp.]|nr:TIGR03009 domain-containing protein [Thermogutta sp.]HPU07598.1 TIGR03009 domain-containing protein [Thermogutta sp.]HQF13921.1 TIGR03009 domain-containing protein [Thermogutta sp.]
MLRYGKKRLEIGKTGHPLVGHLAVLAILCLPAHVMAQGIPQGFQAQTPTGNAAPGYPNYRSQPGAQPVPGNTVSPGAVVAGQSVPPQGGNNVVAPPFVLTPAEQEQLDRVLLAWEERSSKIKTFECEFTRWEFDPVWGPPNQPKRIVRGKIMYSAPDKGLFRVDEEVINGRLQPAAQPERWVCDGRSIYEYRFETKQIVETPLPPELQGKTITEGPLPFLFGAQAESLKRRYYMRIITPQNVTEEIWLEAFPKYQQEAANFQRAQLILKLPQLDIFALQLYHPSAQAASQSRTVFQFDRIKINAVDFLRLFKEDPFKPVLPDSSWAKVIETSKPGQQPESAMGQRPTPYRAQ